MSTTQMVNKNVNKTAQLHHDFLLTYLWCPQPPWGAIPLDSSMAWEQISPNWRFCWVSSRYGGILWRSRCVSNWTRRQPLGRICHNNQPDVLLYDDSGNSLEITCCATAKGAANNSSIFYRLPTRLICPSKLNRIVFLRLLCWVVSPKSCVQPSFHLL